jgi:hypothetical protein
LVRSTIHQNSKVTNNARKTSIVHWWSTEKDSRSPWRSTILPTAWTSSSPTLSVMLMTRFGIRK